MSYINLRDIIDNKENDPDTYKVWADAFGGEDSLQEQADNEPTMIPESEFKDYAMELAEDIGAISRDANWPLNCIDWTQAADDLSSDYTIVEVDGDTYYYR